MVRLLTSMLYDIFLLFSFYILIKRCVENNISQIGKLNHFLLLIWFCSTIFPYIQYWSDNKYYRYFDLIITLVCLLRLCNLEFQINNEIKVFGIHKMKYYHQKDNRWVKIKYGNKAIGSIGCLPTVMAMIHSIIDPEITPIHTAKWAQDNNFVKNGTSREFYLKYSKNYGFISHYIERNSVNEVVDALKNNKFVCISIQNHFSKILKLLNMPQSHAICAYNIDSDNNVLIVDPDDSSRLLKPIKLNYILKRVSKLDKRNTHPFVCIDLPSPEMKTTKKQR